MARYCQILCRLLVQLTGKKAEEFSELESQEAVRLNRVQKRLTCGGASYQLIRKATSFRETSKNPAQEEITLLTCSIQQWTHTRNLSRPAQAILLTKMSRFLIDANESILEDPRTAPFTFVLTQGSAELVEDGKRVKLLQPGDVFGRLCEINGDTENLGSLETCVLWGLHKDELSEAFRRASLETAAPMQRLINSVPLLSQLRESQKAALIDLLLSEYWPQGTRLSGDRDPWEMLWVILSGKLQCLNTSQILESGDYFGGALGLPDQVTNVVALEESVLVSLPKVEIETVLNGSIADALRNNLLTDALAVSKALHVLNPKQVRALLKVIQVKEYTAGTVIAQASELKAKRLIILIKGQVHCGQQKQSSLKCFGDKALTSASKAVYVHDLVADTAVTVGECSSEAIEQSLQLWLSRLRSVNKLTSLFGKMPLFSTLPKAKLKSLALAVKTRQYSANQVIFKKGNKGDSLYIVKRGLVVIRKNGVLLRKLSPYSHFGEHSLLKDRVRTADAIASGATSCWVLAKTDLLSLIDEQIRSQLLRRMMLQDDSVTLKSLAAVNVLGQGSFGKVFLCAHKDTGARYAVKVMDLGIIARYNYFRQLGIEREVLLALDHPFIMKLVRILKDSYRVYYVTEHVEGSSFNTVLETLGAVEEVNTRFYTACLVLILQYLHKKDIAFRDLKPSNIIVDQEGYLKLVDFGTAKVVRGRTYSVLGTPYYMAPEVILGNGYSQTADLWSLGVILYEIAFGTVPFGSSASSINEIFRDIVEGQLTLPVKTKHSAEFHALLEQLLAQKPYLRNLGSTASLRKHAWFKGFSWVSTRQNQLSVRALKPAYIPTIRSMTAQANQAMSSSADLSQMVSRSVQGPQYPITQEALEWLAKF